MLRSVMTLNLPDSIKYKLQEIGFCFCEDIISAVQSEPPKPLQTILESYNVIDCLQEVPQIISVVDMWQKECLSSSIPIFHKGLDHLLNGGLPLGRFIEFCGGPGSGKTQMCLQFSVDAITPSVLGGANGEVLFICTDNSFRVKRLKQIAESSVQHWQNVCQDPNFSKHLNVNYVLKRIHIISVIDHSELMFSLSKLRDYIKTHNKITLIVVDSFSLPFVCEFVETLPRTKWIYNALDILQQCALEFNIAVIVTNQFTTLFTPGTESKLMPSLGESFGHKIHKRIFLGDGKACLMKSIESPQVATSFIVTENGIR